MSFVWNRKCRGCKVLEVLGPNFCVGRKVFLPKFFLSHEKVIHMNYRIALELKTFVSLNQQNVQMGCYLLFGFVRAP